MPKLDNYRFATLREKRAESEEERAKKLLERGLYDDERWGSARLEAHVTWQTWKQALQDIPAGEKGRRAAVRRRCSAARATLDRIDRLIKRYRRELSHA